MVPQPRCHGAIRKAPTLALSAPSWAMQKWEGYSVAPGNQGSPSCKLEPGPGGADGDTAGFFSGIREPLCMH